MQIQIQIMHLYLSIIYMHIYIDIEDADYRKYKEDSCKGWKKTIMIGPVCKISIRRRTPHEKSKKDMKDISGESE